MKKLFFNSSLPRSCSTLLQNIIGQNPDFHVTPTDGTLELLYSARINYANSPEFKAQDSSLMEKGWLNFCKKGLYGFYEAITEKPYVISKSRGWGLHYTFLRKFLGEDPKIICMVRDIKSIVTSLEKIHREKEEVSTDGMINHSQMTNTSTAKRVDSFLNSQPLGLALERTREILQFGLGDKILFIRAEDLTKNPQQQIERVYQYLDVPTYTHDFNNVEQITTEDDEVYGLIKTLHQIKKDVKPIKDDSEKILGKDICKWLDENPNFEWYRRAFGYGNWKYKAEYI